MALPPYHHTPGNHVVVGMPVGGLLGQHVPNDDQQLAGNGDGGGDVTTTYVLDIATPLTMALPETTGTGPTIYYLHGLGLVAQSDGTDTEYFAYDGLGSVRQLMIR